MGGNAVFAGTNYQASVVAYTFVHVLAEAKLRWLPVPDDTPAAVSGEVSGPGDDARIEFASGYPPVEIQAKHGLKPEKAKEACRTIRDASTGGAPTSVLLTVDSTSSPAIRSDLRRDLDRLRAGRSDHLKGLASDLVAEFGDAGRQILQRIHIRQVDVKYVTDNEAARALEILTDNLADPGKAMTVWGILEKDAAAMCTDRSPCANNP